MPKPAPHECRQVQLRNKTIICLALIVVTAAAYWQVRTCGFIKLWDDRWYVTTNQHITRGFDSDSLSWAFTTYRCGNWHPLTWLSYIADYRMFGLDPAGYHIINLAFHIANALLLFLLLTRMTGAVWRSAFTAALFALHPLHVESVAWVSERKDVLSAFFWFLTMYGYVLRAKRPRLSLYLPVLVAFGLALMSKPMAVSLPLVLLLMDYWPLKRAGLGWRLIWEKAPLLAMSAGSCIITFVAQRSVGAVVGLGDASFGLRLANALVSYVSYILKMLWPAKLAMLYPTRTAIPAWQPLAAGLAMAVVTWFVLRYRKRLPYLAVGWLWYVVTLVPVIGLVQVGLQSMADRYAYLPLIGLYVMVAWGVSDILSGRSRIARNAALAAAAAALGVLAVFTWQQVRVWKDSYTVFDHAVKVTEANFLAYHARGVALSARGKTEEAIADFARSVETRPDYGYAHDALGAALIRSGDARGGIDHLLTALRLGRNGPLVHSNLACAYFSLGEVDAAEEQCRLALTLDRQFADAHNLLGLVLYKKGRVDDAAGHFQIASRDRRYADPHGNLASLYYSKHDYRAAWREIHLFESKGGHPDRQFLADLSRQMPDPERQPERVP